MNKLIGTLVIFLSYFIISTAHANCGPRISFSGSTSDSSDHEFSYDDRRNNRAGITITWYLGKDYCEERNEERLKKAKVDREKRELDILREKIRICKPYNKTTVPASLVSFCGDLIKDKINHD